MFTGATRWRRGIEEVAIGAEILATYVEASWLLRRARLQEAVAAMRIRARPHVRWSPTDSEAETAQRLGCIVTRALAQAPAKSPCLTRSLVLAALLARRNIPHSVVIGVRSEPSFQAHAWVEHRSRPVLATEPSFLQILEL